MLSLLAALPLAGCDDGSSAGSIPPVLVSVVPAVGSSIGGVPATLVGSGFTAKGAGDLTVTFGGAPATGIDVLHETTITCMPPPGVPGTSVDVQVFNAIGASYLEGAYRYAGLPLVSDVTPPSGSSLGGATVTLEGEGFLDDLPGANTVTFDGVPAAAVITLDDNTITCSTPPGVPSTTVDVRVQNVNGETVLPLAFSNHALPTISSLDEPTGTSLGGTPVSVFGTGFLDFSAGANTVLFGVTPATNVLVVSDTELSCESPPGDPAAAVDVAVLNANGAAVAAGAFSYHPLPALGAVTPPGGSYQGGTEVTLTGSGFLNGDAGVNQVLFGGVSASAVAVLDDATLTCQTPAGTLSSAVDVEVRNGNGAATLSGAFLYTTEPSVSAVAPPSGPTTVSTSVSISGAGFVNDAAGTNTVLFDGIPALGVVAVDDATIQCDTPPGTAAGPVDVTVTNNNGTAVLTEGYTYGVAPTLVSATPPQGTPLGGTVVTLTGTGFADFVPGVNVVTFDGVNASAVNVVSDTTLTCLAPPGAAGTLVDVALTNDNGSAALSSAYSYHPHPTLDAVAPPAGSGSGGNGVTLTGSGFQNLSPGVSAVTFAGLAAPNVVIVSDTSLTCDVPAGTPGDAVDVVLSNDNGSVTLADGYAYHAAPTLGSVSPPTGTSLGSTGVTLTGTGFEVNDAGTNVVLFNGVAATSVSIVDDSTLSCQTPAGPPGALVVVDISNDNGLATLAGAFTYNQLPVLSTVSPAAGPLAGGDTVTLTGSGFLSQGAGTNAVTFDGVPATGVTVANDTSLTCVVPAGVLCGPVDVRVSNLNGSSQLSGGFTYLTDVSATASLVLVDSPFGALANGADAVSITVTVLDDCSTPMPGEPVELRVGGSANTVTPSTGATDASGIFTATLTTTLAEVKTIAVAVRPGLGEVILADQPTAEFVWEVPGYRYIRVTGSDANGGTSPTDAWRTLGRAASSVVPGDTVFVGAGTYVGAVSFVANGTPASPIRFTADRLGQLTGDAGDVLLDGGGGAFTLDFDGAGDIEIEGFSITGATADGTSAGVRLRNLAQGITLRGNRLYGSSFGLHGSLVEDVTFEENVVSNNLATGLFLRDTNTIALTGNLIYNNGLDGVELENSSAEVVANTVYLNGGDGFDLNTGGSSNIRNNIITSHPGAGLRVSGGAAAVSRHNDVWNNAGGDWVGILPGSGDLSANPSFVDPAGPDGLLGGANAADDSFHLSTSPGSFALDAGSADAHLVELADGTNLADKTTRIDDVLDGATPDADTLNLGYHSRAGMGTPPELAPGDARLAYVTGSTEAARRPLVRGWQDALAAWSAAALGFPVGSAAGVTRSVVVESSPLHRDEDLLIALSEDAIASTTELDVHRWAGAEWVLEWSSADIDTVHAKERAFDVAYEEDSGDALVVYSDGTATPVYRVFSQGLWTAEVALPLNDGAGPNPDVNTGAVRWMELIAGPDGSEITLLYADENADLIGVAWDGAAWDSSTAFALETDLRTNPVSGEVSNRCFDAAYERASGDLVVAWAVNGVSGFMFTVRPAGSSGWGTPQLDANAPAGGIPQFVDLASQPSTDRVAGVFLDLGDGIERLGLATWNGTGWVHSGEYDSQITDVNDTATGDFPGAVAWVGTSGVAICVFADDATGTLDWASWTAITGWVVQADVPIATKGTTESVLLEHLAGQNKVVAVLSDDLGQLFAATYDGLSWVVSGGGLPLATDLFVDDSMPFSLDAK
ncbi:MAG: IPT/TIG domain-containing protein [Planctomycetota bacterium]